LRTAPQPNYTHRICMLTSLGNHFDKAEQEKDPELIPGQQL
jgi:hypothetical protein